MEEVFGVSTVEPHANFFDLGGHSLTATRVASRLSTALNVPVPIRLVFEAPTPIELSAAITRECRALSDQGSKASSAVEIVDASKLTASQRRMWLLHVADPASVAYNVGGALEVNGDFDTALATVAFRMCLEAHPVLRATYATEDGLPVQRILPIEDIDLDDVTCDYRGTDNAMSLVKSEAAKLNAAPFDLERGPLYRFRIFRISEESHILTVCFHHIVIDGWAIGVFVRDFFQYYAAAREGRLSETIPNGAIASIAVLPQAAERPQLDYWKRTLQGAPDSLDLPVDHTPPLVDASAGAVCRVPLPPDVIGELQRVARTRKASLFMMLLAGFQVVLARYARQRDLLIGVPVANRNRQESEGVISSMVNTLPYRAVMSDDPTLSELISRVREAVIDMQDHQDVPLETILSVMERSDSRGGSPFRVMFDYQDISLPEGGPLKLNADLWELDRGAAQFDLSLFVTDINGSYLAAIEYRPSLFEASTIRRMGEHFVNILWRLAIAGSSARESVLTTPMLSTEQRTRMLTAWNETEMPLKPGENLLHDFATQAEENPSAIAVSCGTESAPYADLDASSNRIARFLQQQGIGKGDSVAIYVDRSIEMVTVLLGILKSGACYIPLDPEYPVDRIALILEDAAPQAVVANSSAALRSARDPNVLHRRSGFAPIAGNVQQRSGGEHNIPR